jgi:uncharacterized protein (DUF1697 family)
MTRQVALLRGINVGRSKRVGMADLRESVEALGYDDVRTYLQSGNVVFTGKDGRPERAAQKIEDQLAERLGLDVRVLVRTRDELAEVIDRNPLSEIASDPRRLLVAFLSSSPDPKRLRDVDPADFEPDAFAVGAREIYLWCPDGFHATKLGHAFWEKQLQLTATARNWNTVTKLLALADG